MEQDETTKRDSKGIFMTISSNYPGWFRWMHSEQGRCFYWMKVSYYPNATSTFQFMMILKSGNVPLNPGPTAKALVEKKSCLVCSRTGARNHGAVECCFICKRWCHIKCDSISPRRYNELAKNNSIWRGHVLNACIYATFAQGSSTSYIIVSSESAELPLCSLSDDALEEGANPFYYDRLKGWILVGRGLFKSAHINVNGILTKCKLNEIKLLLKSTRLDVLG